MKKFSIKLLFFLLPVAAINFILISRGFLFSIKDGTFVKILLEKLNNTAEIRIGFFGTSRTNVDISPRFFLDGLDLRGKKAKALNLGMDGISASATISLTKKNSVDIAFLELLPYGSLLSDKDIFSDSIEPAKALDDVVNFCLTKHFVLIRANYILLYLQRRTPIYFENCHGDGWTEVKAVKNSVALKNLQYKWIEAAKQGVERVTSSDAISKFAALIKNHLDPEKTIIVFLFMPVAGDVQSYQAIADRKNRIFKKLLGEFPDALFIETNNVIELSHFATFDFSHLDSENAKQFSYALARTVSREIAKHQLLDKLNR